MSGREGWDECVCVCVCVSEVSFLLHNVQSKQPGLCFSSNKRPLDVKSLWFELPVSSQIKLTGCRLVQSGDGPTGTQFTLSDKQQHCVFLPFSAQRGKFRKPF